MARCRQCSLGFANPQPSDDELAQIYDGTYYQTFGYSDANAVGYQMMQRARAMALLQDAERRVRVGRMLDVGSALGFLLLTAQERDWTVNGVEPNAFAAAHANRMLPGSTWHGPIESYAPPDGATFDLVTCLDVIEHLRRPDQFLRCARSYLRPGGLLLLTTINQNSLWEHCLGPRWVHYHRDHLWYFTPRTLIGFAESAGLEVLRCGSPPKAFNTTYILEIFAHGSEASLARTLADWGLRYIPRALRNQMFWIKEGMMLIARRPHDG